MLFSGVDVAFAVSAVFKYRFRITRADIPRQKVRTTINAQILFYQLSIRSFVGACEIYRIGKNDVPF